MKVTNDINIIRNYSFSYKLQLASLILIALTLPFSILLNNLAIGLLSLSWLLSGAYAERLKAAFRNKLFLLFLGVFMFQLLGLLYTSNVGEGLDKVERKAALLVIPFVLAGTKKLRKEHLYAVVSTFILACTVLALYGAFILFNTDTRVTEEHGLTEYIDHVLNMHHAYSGLYFVFAVLASFYLAFSTKAAKGKRAKTLLIGAALFLFVFLIVLAARTAVLTLFLLFIAGVVYYILQRRSKKIWIVAAFACVAVTVVVMVLPNTKKKIEDFDKLRGVHSPLTPRLIQWGCCFTVLNEQDAWLYGVGTGDVQDHLQQCYSDEKFWGEHYDLNAHNEYLEELVRHGLPGGILFFASLVVPFIMSLKYKKPFYALFLFILMMSMVTESTLSRQKGVVFYALFNSLMAFHYLPNRPDEERLIAPL